VEEESAQELHGVQGHDALLAAVSIILIAEGNALRAADDPPALAAPKIYN
jgi:hypothetical protein